ncbi:carbamoyltransferase HypF [Chloroflexota bacterium]
MVLVGVKKLARISVRGVVQGVGFRPFIYRLAREHNLKGWVRNTSSNVEIEVEGDEGNLNVFLKDLETRVPPMAHIESVEATFHHPAGYTNFEIHQSLSQEGKYQLVSPDIATCEDCRDDIFSPANRRFGYPFTNCTNCGPRFTIIEDIPYDRPKTTMHKFKMCPECQREYDNPLDRRFHAQPNACPICGPSLELVDGNGSPVECDDVIKMTGNLLRAGNIMAIRGLGGFHLACDATSEKAINLLRTRKKRPAKPLAVMVATMADVEKHCLVSPEEKKLLQSPECPIVLLKWNSNSSDISPAVAPNIKYLGVMLPYTPLHQLLLRETGLPLVMTSGNLSEEPIAKYNDEALKRLSGIADYFLLHNRDIYARYDDSVYMVEDEPQPIRRARGYAPYPIFLPFKSKQILACGAEEKNTFCLTKDKHAFLSQHIGDMENEETLEHFENTIELYKKLFRVEPEIMAYDMHPEYLSTKYALEVGKEQGLSLVPVQHHHAHVVSCMIEHHTEGPVIGVAFDGTGYGTDGTVWGGEFLLADCHRFDRVAHLECVPMGGGATAIKKPYRMALSYLYTLLGEDFALKGLPLNKLNQTELDVAKQQLRRKINSPLTSSAGRLFDAVAAITGVKQEIEYEAQAAIELEMIAPDNTNESEWKSYPFLIDDSQGTRVIRLKELLSAIIEDVRSQVPVPAISLKFHRTIAEIIAETCRVIAEETNAREVVLSGGVFQNRLLFKLAIASLRRANLKVLTHHLVPCNDGGISLGQAVIANFNSR